ncbi:MAG: hypothetical protein SH850_07555 [Planctomycetaceae bacterium]|nr:hypothetical protein [Planctomycetaceae bacterium]
MKPGRLADGVPTGKKSVAADATQPHRSANFAYNQRRCELPLSRHEQPMDPFLHWVDADDRRASAVVAVAAALIWINYYVVRLWLNRRKDRN